MKAMIGGSTVGVGVLASDSLAGENINIVDFCAKAALFIFRFMSSRSLKGRECCRIFMNDALQNLQKF